VDPTRVGPGGARQLWTYAHVPNSSTHDMTEVVTAQIERCAPASVSMYRMLARPVPRWDPYRTPLDNVYLCSGSAPPGPGLHGMCGMHAATRVLREQFGIRQLPDIGPTRC
jgi:hypothetical protein